MDIIRTIGASWFPAFFAKDKPMQPAVKPVLTYEQACKEHLQKFNELCCKFHPVYFTKNGFYYQVIDECTCIEVDTKTGSRGVHKGSTPSASVFYALVLHQQLEQKGFEIITASEFKYHYTQVMNEVNLSVNQAIQS